MAYHEEESTKLRRQSSKQAIALAMEGRWREAVTANQSLIESFPDDVDAFNRLGRAHMELGEYALARQAYQKAVKVDPYNTIARKNLNRLSRLGKTEVDSSRGGQEKVEPQQFIEEVGKAGTVNLIHLASHATLATLAAGDMVKLKVENGHLVVQNSQGKNIGAVDPRYGQRLARLMKGGNRYSAVVSGVTANAVSVLIREESQAPGQKGLVSFPPKPVRVQSFVRSKASREEEFEEAEDDSGEGDGDSGGREDEERMREGFELEVGNANED